MKRNRELVTCGLMVLLLGLGLTQGMAAETDGGSAPWAKEVVPATQLPRVALPAVDRQVAAQQDSEREAAGLPYRFAEPRQVELTPWNSGTWQMLPGTDRLWRLRLNCPGALSLNLGFTRFQLVRGATLRIAASDGQGPALVFGAEDERSHGQLWTPVLLTDDLVVELHLPAGAAADYELELTTVGCGYRLFGEQAEEKSGACNIDVICAEGDGWRDEIATVGVYTVNGNWTCTGAMVNNTAQDERPLFLTAHHCGVGPVQAATVVVYWNFESPSCGQHGGGSLAEFTSGATLLASYDVSDFTLLELADDPDPVFGVNFAGWDRSPTVPQSAVAIHHPSTDEKSISFEDDPLSVTSYASDESPGNSTHLRIADWDLGTTEVGSSGSPLFNGQQLIVGQLHGGYAACDNDLPDWYGRLYTSWEGGGTADTRLRNWLDPTGSGVQTLDLLDPEGGPVDPVPGNADIAIVSLAPNPFQDFQEINLRLKRDAWTTARVFDLHGKLVADLGGRLLTVEEATFAWDGHDQDGKRLAAGVYVLVVEADGKQARRQFVRLN